jgi:hypothetical protein
MPYRTWDDVTCVAQIEYLVDLTAGARGRFDWMNLVASLAIRAVHWLTNGRCRFRLLPQGFGYRLDCATSFFILGHLAPRASVSSSDRKFAFEIVSIHSS